MRKILSKEQEKQIYKKYFSKEKPSTIALAEEYNCAHGVISDSIIRNGGTPRTNSESHKGQKAWNKGKHLSEDHRRKIGNKHIGKKRPPFSKITKQKMREKALTPKRIQQLLKNNQGTKCYYYHKFFPSLGERDCYIYIVKLGFKVIHNFLGRFDFLVVLTNNKKVVIEFHPYDLKGLTYRQYYYQRRKLLNEYGYKDLKLVVIKNLKEIENKLK